MVSPDLVQPEYRGQDDRLAEWRRASLWRQRRLDDLATVPDPRYHERNLAARPGARCRVDAFLGTINTPAVAAAYAAPEQVGAAGFRFRAERPTHPRLAALRSRYDLETIAGTGGDLDRGIRLRDWVKSRWSHQVPWCLPPYDGLAILERAERTGEQFLCMNYSITFVHCCLSLGVQARLINLHRGISESYEIGREGEADPPVDEHVTSEVWSRELGKWVMLDTDYDCHYERDGEPLSAWEIHCAGRDGEQAALTVRKGPGAADWDWMGADYYATTLIDYYAHVSVLIRNDVLSDPDGPIPALHLTDDATPPILWYRGEDMRLRRDLLGPLVVANPYTDTTPLLTDGNLESGWASPDTAEEHWAEIELAGAETVTRVVLHWPEWRQRRRTSRTYRVQCRTDGRWETVSDAADNPEHLWTAHDFEPRTADAVRVVQPAGGGFPDHPNRLWLTQVVVL